MRSSMLIAVVLTALVALGAAAPSASVAAARPAPLAFSPASPLDSQPVKVTWRADREPRAGYSYRLELVTGDQVGCMSNSGADIEPTWRKGARIRVTLRPVTERVWCRYRARLRLTATRGLAGVRPGTVIAAARVPITDDAKTPPPDPPGVDAKIDLLEGSSMTVHIAGRPDRSSALTGRLTGRIPGKFRPRTDLTIDLRPGTLSITGLPPDPLCTASGKAYPSPLKISGDHSSIFLGSSGITFMTLLLGDEPLTLTGCQGPPPTTIALPVSVAGKVGPKGLVVLALSGGYAGVKLNDGVEAAIDLDLVVRIDLSGR